MQYDRNDFDFSRGCFRVRGDVIDIFPAENNETAVRVSLFDDEVEHITLFDPLTGQVFNKIQRFTIYPSSHYVTSRETTIRAMEGIKQELRDRVAFFIKENKLVEAQRIEQRTRFDLEMLNEIGFCKGIENYTRHLSGAKPGDPPPTLIDYLPDDALMIIDESHVTVPQIGGMFWGTVRVSLTWWITAGVCHRLWIIAHLNLKSLNASCANVCLFQPRLRIMKKRINSK